MAAPKPSKSQAAPKEPSNKALTPPAQQVWLAGLGAMAKAQEQGSKAIETLLNDGLAFQRKSQAEAQQRLQEATERLSHLASDLGHGTSGRVDKLEHLFEDRVAKALHRLGMPSLIDIQMRHRVKNQPDTHRASCTWPKKPPAAPPSALRR
jgi:poly(hydroxyalkanoate) granule-associated protein